MSGTERLFFAAFKEGEFRLDDAGRIWTRDGQRAEREDRDGYLLVRTTLASGRRVHAAAHRVVWHMTQGPIPAGQQINHQNGRKQDNRPENLETTSHAENMAHASRTGLLGARQGERNPAAKLTGEAVRAIRERHKAGGVTQRELAAEYGVSPQQLSRILRGERWA